MSAGSPVRYVLARLPVRVGASIGKLPENSAVCARADDGRSCGRCGREAVVAREDEEITFFEKDALLYEGVPEGNCASWNRSRRSNSRLRSGCNDKVPGWPDLHISREPLAAKEKPGAFMGASLRQIPLQHRIWRSPANFTEQIPTKRTD